MITVRTLMGRDIERAVDKQRAGEIHILRWLGLGCLLALCLQLVVAIDLLRLVRDIESTLHFNSRILLRVLEKQQAHESQPARALPASALTTSGRL